MTRTTTTRSAAPGRDKDPQRVVRTPHGSLAAARVAPAGALRRVTHPTPIFQVRDALALQRSVGNRATAALLGRRPVPAAQKSNSQLRVQRVFNPAEVTGTAHLRQKGAWATHHGDRIATGTSLLVDPDNPVDQERKFRPPIRWLPAVKQAPDSHSDAIPETHLGYLRSSKARQTPSTLEGIFKARITQILKDAGSKFTAIGDKLAAPAHVDFLLEKGLRYGTWKGADLNTFADAFRSKEAKFQRFATGAKFLAAQLDYWRAWLHSEQPEEVDIDKVKLVKSDLHERGLGVAHVKFKKPLGPEGFKFANDVEVDVMLKPEDKSLEKKLLGDDETSAASQINEIVGLTEPDAMLTTIRMQSNAIHGTLVERVKGTPAEKLTNNKQPVSPAFHETLVFAFLAGLDDLHGENVFWSDENGSRPYLIDADNVLIYNQMVNEANGKLVQTGFSSFNEQAANENKRAIINRSNSVNSRILDAMLNEPVKRSQIVDAIKGAITGGKGRVVPISTNRWASLLKGYLQLDSQGKEQTLNAASDKDHLVRKDAEFDASIGPGLYGVAGENTEDPHFGQDVEKQQTKADFEAGVIPFYEYNYDSGHVTHNGVEIYRGRTLQQAMQQLLDYFTANR